MKAVTRYQCEHCAKDFKTPDRHQCKKNPELKNCFSCKFSKGISKGYEQRSFPEYVDFKEEPSPICMADDPNPEECDIWILKELSYNLQCSSWELKLNGN